MDIKKIKENCRSIRESTKKIRAICNEIFPGEDPLKPMDRAIEDAKKNQSNSANVIFEQKIPMLLEGINVV